MRIGAGGCMFSVDLTAFAAAAGWATLPQGIAALRLEETAAAPRFPGALLPAIAPGGQVVWYAVVPTALAWRRLRPLLMAHAGPTVTTFTGRPTELDPANPAERMLLEAGAAAAAKLASPPGSAGLAARALSRLAAALKRSPSDVMRPPLSTPALLAELDMHLAAADRAGAARCLDVLHREWRLDVMNLRFVEVRIAAAFREWLPLAAQPWFYDLCRIPKPPAVAQALLEALWQARLNDVAGDPAELKARFSGDLRATCLDLLAELPPGAAGPAAAVAAAIAADGAEPAGATLDRAATASQGWVAWADAAAAGTLHSPAEAARQAALEQPASSIPAQPEAEEMAERLKALATDQGGQGALSAALPELVRWLASDPGWPRTEMRPLYDVALTLFVLLEERSLPARQACLGLLDALLSLGPSAADYLRYTQDAAWFVPDDAGTGSAYWLLDLAERVLHHDATDGAARQALLNRLLSTLQQLAGFLSPMQRISYARLAAMAGWPPLAEAITTAEFDVAAALAGKVVALHTLTEAAARQAREALAGAAPDARVEINADHVCTPRLKALARDADLFVVATASAKHTATDCIGRNRPRTMPVAYAAGRGATSILRAIEDSLARRG